MHIFLINEERVAGQNICIFNWILAPEVIQCMGLNLNEDNIRNSTKSDIFYCGCIFFRHLMKGSHPAAILFCNIALKLIYQIIYFIALFLTLFAHDVIKRMLQHSPGERPSTMGEVVNRLYSLDEAIFYSFSDSVFK